MKVYNVLMSTIFDNQLSSYWVVPFSTLETAQEYIKYEFEQEGYNTDFKHESLFREELCNKRYNFSTVSSEIHTGDAVVINYCGYRSEIKGIIDQMTATVQIQEIRDTFNKQTD